ncbi:MAG TPA: PH domain-containing protein [Pseudonocardiaceae bacterium]|nr:PH domain-containing protein [Pseudonocardiaceae bacterium]
MPEDNTPATPASADTEARADTAAAGSTTTAEATTKAGATAGAAGAGAAVAGVAAMAGVAANGGVAASAGVAAGRIALPSRLVFRIPMSALVAVVFMMLCASWVAVASPWLALIYMLPIGVAVWLVRTRTVVDVDKLVVRRVLTRTELPWSAITALRVDDRKWVRAVRTDGGEVVLPTVRTRHLPALALISGGRLPDPTEPGAE